MSKLWWALAFQVGYTGIFRSRGYEVATASQTAKGFGLNAAVGFGNFVHGCAIAGALMAAEDRGYKSGYRTGINHAPNEVKEERWALGYKKGYEDGHVAGYKRADAKAHNDYWNTY